MGISVLECNCSVARDLALLSSHAGLSAGAALPHTAGLFDVIAKSVVLAGAKATS